jgi:hypothetical protein
VVAQGSRSLVVNKNRYWVTDLGLLDQSRKKNGIVREMMRRERWREESKLPGIELTAGCGAKH